MTRNERIRQYFASVLAQTGSAESASAHAQQMFGVSAEDIYDALRVRPESRMRRHSRAALAAESGARLHDALSEGSAA